MKKYQLIVMVLMMVCSLTFLFVSCEQENGMSDRGSIVVQLLPNEKFTTRTIVPEGTNPLQIASYSLSGTGPKSQVLSEIESSSDSITLNNILVGNWHFAATAYNENQKALATGSIETHIVSNENYLNLPLQEVVGEGTLDLSFSWDAEQVKENSSFTITLYDEENQIVSGGNVTSDMQSGAGNFEFTNLSAGFYRVVATLETDSVQISGFSETVRIVDETRTSGSIQLIIGKVIDGLTIVIEDQTDSPIIGSVSPSNQNPQVGDDITLTYTIENSAGYDEDDIIYTWYKDGEIIESQTSKTLTVTDVQSGTARYDVIVGTDENSSLGSSSILIAIEIHPTVNPS